MSCRLKKNVHSYDGGIIKFNIKTKYTFDEKVAEFKKLKSLFDEKIADKVDKKMYLQGIKGINFIENDIQTKKNFSKKDNVYADDILMEICLKINNFQDDKLNDILINIIEQMFDMLKMGRCSSGRVIRLIQIYHVINDKPTDLLKDDNLDDTIISKNNN